LVEVAVAQTANKQLEVIDQLTADLKVAAELMMVAAEHQELVADS
jgi:hypothetical protein